MKVFSDADIQRRTIPPGDRTEVNTMNRRWTLPAVFSVAVVLGYACGTEQTVGSRFVKSELVSSARGGEIAVAPAEEPALAGAKLSVPPNALAKDATLTLELGMTDVSSAPRGPVAIWGPSGTLFSTPAKLTLPLVLSSPDETASIEIVVEEADGRRFVIPNAELTIDAAGRFVTFPVKGFTRFQPGVAPARDAGSAGGSAGGGNAAGGASAGGTAAISCRSDADCPSTHQCALRVPAQPGTCVLRPSTGGGTSGVGGGVAGGNAGGCTNNTQCSAGQTCVIRTLGTPGVCVGGGSGGGNPGTGGGSSGVGGGAAGGNTVIGCTNNSQCAAGQTCAIRVPGTPGICVGGTGGGSSGTGGGNPGTGGGGSGTGGGSGPTPCRTPQECVSPQQCINNICQ